MGHRLRLTVIATLTSSAILFLAFLTAVLVFSRAEYQGLQDVLRPELRQSIGELREKPSHPDLDEIVAAEPSVSVAVLDAQGNVKFSKGSLRLRSMVGEGRALFGSVSSVYASEGTELGRVVVAAPWGDRDARIERLTLGAILLWAACSACVAIVSWLSTKAAFTPLDRLAKEAEALSGNDLSGRLSVKDRGEYASFVARLNGFLDRLETAVKREERFVADAAHELRTPLTIVRGQIETSLSRSRSPEEYQATLATVLDETERLSRMVELLLQSGATSSKMVSAVDLDHEIERVHARWVDRFHDHGVRLEIATKPARALILPSEIDVIVDNLLSNALKVSPPGTCCTLLTAVVGEHARVEVHDQGPGIPEESRGSIFERLTRLDSGRNRNVGGFGIGLAVCKRLVENRGGTIFVEPSTEGAIFVVSLAMVQ